MRKKRLALAVAFSAIMAIGVANQTLPDRQPFSPIGACFSDNPEARKNDQYLPLELDSVALGLAVSGGGSRAAYLAAAVMREMRRSGVRVVTTNTALQEANLLEQIDLISSVSGGSFAATYFVQNIERLRNAEADGSEWLSFLDKMAFPYREDLQHSAMLSPTVWGKWLFSDYNRGSLARERYDKLLFGPATATIADLPQRPALFINAFDVANHVRFIFSRHAMDTTYFLPRDYWGRLHEPRELVTANDMNFSGLAPTSIRLADAVYASSAFPFAYPNMPLKYCGQKILFQGEQLFLADGALADNTGLLTLFAQMRAALKDQKRRAAMVAIAVDASLDRLGSSGSAFQDRGTEDRYAWKNTFVGHANESINGAIALLQDVSGKFLQSSGIVTDHLRENWPQELTKRTGRCIGGAKSSWVDPFESGQLLLRPLVIRLGLRDVLNPDFLMRFAPADAERAEALQLLIRQNELPDGLAQMSTVLQKRFREIETDFVLSATARRTLDLAAYVLVHIKLAADLKQWNTVVVEAARSASAEIKCTN